MTVATGRLSTNRLKFPICMPPLFCTVVCGRLRLSIRTWLALGYPRLAGLGYLYPGLWVSAPGMA